MGRTLGVSAWLLGLGLALAACGGSSKTPPGSEEEICTPGARTCEGLSVKLCNDAGTKESIETTCLPSESCADGVCGGTSCVPNTKFCKEGQVYKCDSKGSGSMLAETCSTTEFCLEEDDDAECSDTACSAGEPMCDDTIATTCLADGSGPKPGGTDCADTGQVCYQGACRDQACTEGQKVCQHDDVYLCANSGSDVALLADCAETEVCDAMMGSCRPKVCEAGKMDCDATRVVTCNQYGSGWEQTGTDCTATDEICLAGACKKQVCTPSSYFCKDGHVQQCDSGGTKSTQYQYCDPGYMHCEPYYAMSYASCAYNQCTPGQILCDGDYVKTCTETGSLPVNGTYCGADKYCENGTCKQRECETYTYLCKDGDIYYCDYYTQPTVSQYCLSDSACKEIDGSFACVPLPCSPGEKSCLENKVGTCATDGGSLSSVSDDCTVAGNVCNSAGTCVESVAETLGTAENGENVESSYLIGDAVEMDSNRKVIEIEANLVLAAPRELRWVIYEQSGTTFVARIDKIVSNQSGTGFFSSGPMSYTLKAGKRYLLAVAVSGGNAVAFYDAAPWNLNLSFGNPLGRVGSYYASTISADYYYQEYLYQMRVTTALP